MLADLSAPMMLLLLLAAHCLADYAWQGDFMAKAKNRAAPIPGVPFWQPLTAHAVIHGALVGAITGLWWLAIPEAVAHWLIDDAKCRGRITYNVDQAFHVLCKLAWWCIAVTAA